LATVGVNPYPVVAPAPQSNSPPQTVLLVPERIRDWVRLLFAVEVDDPTFPRPLLPRHTHTAIPQGMEPEDMVGLATAEEPLLPAVADQAFAQQSLVAVQAAPVIAANVSPVAVGRPVAVLAWSAVPMRTTRMSPDCQVTVPVLLVVPVVLQLVSAYWIRVGAGIAHPVPVTLPPPPWSCACA
jgi:hypothetical protein